MNNPFNDLFGSMHRLYTEQQELAAIWLEKPLLTATGSTSRITPGAIVRVENGRLTDCGSLAHATHKVIGCLGTMINQFEFVLTDIHTNEPITIKL